MAREESQKVVIGDPHFVSKDGKMKRRSKPARTVSDRYRQYKRDGLEPIGSTSVGNAHRKQ